MTSEQGTSSLAIRVLNFMDRVRDMARRALHLGVQRSFAIVCSHYENINRQTMSQRFVLDYDDTELDRIEEEVVPLVCDLTASMEDEVIPIKKNFGN